MWEMLLERVHPLQAVPNLQPMARGAHSPHGQSEAGADRGVRRLAVERDRVGSRGAVTPIGRTVSGPPCPKLWHVSGELRGQTR